MYKAYSDKYYALEYSIGELLLRAILRLTWTSTASSPAVASSFSSTKSASSSDEKVDIACRFCLERFLVVANASLL
jgi:hypothetical protein